MLYILLLYKKKYIYKDGESKKKIKNKKKKSKNT